MLDNLNGQLGAKLVVAVVVVAIALIVFYLVSRAWRGRGTRAFLRGGRNRQPRLAVLDAAAVDAKHRLVLVRRDGVEHLLLIGGPTDLVVESGIGASQPQRQDEETSGEKPVRRPTRTTQQTESETLASRAKVAVAAPQTAAVEEAPSEPVEKGNSEERPAPTAVGSDSAEKTGDKTAKADNRQVPAGDYGEAAPRSQADVANILDDQRARVFGPAASPQDSAYVRAYADTDPSTVEPAADIRPAPASVVQFEDFLDEEIAGDLSKVTPTEEPVASEDARRPEPRRENDQAAKRESSLDEEMSRLLGTISDKRK